MVLVNTVDPQATYWLTMTVACVPAQQMNWQAKDTVATGTAGRVRDQWIEFCYGAVTLSIIGRANCSANRP